MARICLGKKYLPLKNRNPYMVFPFYFSIHDGNACQEKFYNGKEKKQNTVQQPIKLFKMVL